MTPENIDKFNFSIIENGFYIKKIKHKTLKIIDADNVIVQLSYNSLSPLYSNRDITFHLNTENHFTFNGENYIFNNNGGIYDYEMNTLQIDERLSKFINQHKTRKSQTLDH